jgi:hypothetical protein
MKEFAWTQRDGIHLADGKREKKIFVVDPAREEKSVLGVPVSSVR